MMKFIRFLKFQASPYIHGGGLRLTTNIWSQLEQIVVKIIRKEHELCIFSCLTPQTFWLSAYNCTQLRIDMRHLRCTSL